jgi:DNA-directed RNA polymerase subunit RPC12/RpoP
VSRRTENISFLCMNCGKQVVPLSNGSYRNHCPHCLHSLHVDNMPGDRSSNCGGIMKPVKLIYNSKKGYQIQHKCSKCGSNKVNIIAEDTVMPDDYRIILTLSSKQ